MEAEVGAQGSEVAADMARANLEVGKGRREAVVVEVEVLRLPRRNRGSTIARLDGPCAA